MSMPAAILAVLWLACTSDSAPTPSTPASAPPPTPTDTAWPYAWNVAAVVLVGAPGSPSERLDGAAIELSAEELVLRDALAGTPVELWRAAPGASLRIEPRRPGWSLDVLAIDLPAEIEAGSRIVQTDRGRHRLVWPVTSRVREVQVALGMAPWRAIVAVGRELPAEMARGPLAERLTEAGVARRKAEPGQSIVMPLEDLELERVDAATLPGGGSGIVLLERGRTPWLVRDEARWSEEAAIYFQVRLPPARRVGEDERGSGERGPGAGEPGELASPRPDGRPGRGPRPGNRGPMGPGRPGAPGKAGKRPGVSGGGAGGAEQ